MQIFVKKKTFFAHLFAYLIYFLYLCMTKFCKKAMKHTKQTVIGSRLSAARIMALVCMMIVAANIYAQEKSIRDAGLEQRDFFDPTRTEKVVENYEFGIAYHIEGGYAQAHQRMMSDTISAMYLHGARIGAQFEMFLPQHFSLNIGLLYSVLYGVSNQHYHSANSTTVQKEVLSNHIVEHALTIPVRVQYNIPLWKQLSMHFYGGPQVMIGLAETDYVKADVSAETRAWLIAQGKHLDTYDKYISKELFRTNIQMGVGGGFTWDVYRLEAGYDFGLNNLIRTPAYSKDKMAEWQWHVSFVYTL